VREIRVFVETPLQAGRPCLIEGPAANHITRVLRLREGDSVTLFDGRGGEYSARITAFRKDSVSADVTGRRDAERESALELTLAQGISRGERMDWVMQKATELGVTRIIPVITERTMVKLDERQAERKLQHWRGIVIAACEQSGRNRVPEVAEPAPLYQVIRSFDAATTTRVLLSPAGALNARDLPRSPHIAMLIGPEGGLSENEQDAAVSEGFQQVRMGPRILRTETAAIAALTTLQHNFGDL
jgi:16S rRNA (uracil1498-N3)-methyltransferase